MLIRFSLARASVRAVSAGALLSCVSLFTLVPACKKGGDDSSGGAARATVKDMSEVKQDYSDQRIESGTVSTRGSAVVRAEPTDSGKVLATLGNATMVERKARRGQWMLVNWPSGEKQLSPGWVLSSTLGESAPATIKTVAPPVATTAPPAATTAPTPAGGRPPGPAAVKTPAK